MLPAGLVGPSSGMFNASGDKLPLKSSTGLAGPSSTYDAGLAGPCGGLDGGLRSTLSTEPGERLPAGEAIPSGLSGPEAASD